MSAALPIELAPLRIRTTIYSLLGTMSVIWIAMWFASDNRAHGSAYGIRFVFAASCVLIGAIGAAQMLALTRARQVLGKQLMPDALWGTWLRASVVETSLIWAFVVAAMSFLLASRASTTPWPAAIALLSGSLSLGALVALAYRSMLPKWARWIVYAAAGAITMASLQSGAEQPLKWFVSLSPLVLGILALSWPVLAVELMHRWRSQLPAYRWSPPLARGHMLASVGSQLRRFSPIDARNKSFSLRATPELAGWRLRMVWLFSISFPVYVFFDSLSPLVLGQQPDARHLMSLAVLCLAMGDLLVARDLHWRALLMPGGWRREKIASRIFISTLLVQCAVVAVAAVPILLATRMANPYLPLSLALEAVAGRIAPLLFEIAFATSVGLVIRALPHRKVLTIVAAVVTACCWVYVRLAVGYAMLPRAPAVSVAYLAVMAALSIVILYAANRLWTPNKLMACARQS